MVPNPKVLIAQREFWGDYNIAHHKLYSSRQYNGPGAGAYIPNLNHVVAYIEINQTHSIYLRRLSKMVEAKYDLHVQFFIALTSHNDGTASLMTYNINGRPRYKLNTLFGNEGPQSISSHCRCIFKLITSHARHS